jgi:hypothetical protein
MVRTKQHRLLSLPILLARARHSLSHSRRMHLLQDLQTRRLREESQLKMQIVELGGLNLVLKLVLIHRPAKMRKLMERIHLLTKEVKLQGQEIKIKMTKTVVNRKL